LIFLLRAMHFPREPRSKNFESRNVCIIRTTTTIKFRVSLMLSFSHKSSKFASNAKYRVSCDGLQVLPVHKYHRISMQHTRRW